MPITYTLTLTNTGDVTATHLLVTDTLPSGASYLSGCARAGDVVTWTLSSLPPDASASLSLVVTATQTITNSDYRVAVEGRLAAVGQAPVVTIVADEAIAGLSAANDSPTELGQATSLTATITAGSHVSYTWAFGDEQTGSGAVATHTYPATGAYTAVVTAGNTLSVMTATTQVTITGAPEPTIAKYYYHGGQRVAMRQGDVVYYLYSDHLGSSSLTTDHTGAPVAQTRYLPYGEERWAGGTTQPTDFTFTNQRVERSFGLMDYRARFYDAHMGRFISADTVVPEPDNPQALNRYAYTYNNPLRYTDPSGHYIFEDEPDDPYIMYEKSTEMNTLVRAANPEAVGLWEAEAEQSLEQKPFARFSTEGGIGGLPNPHVELREDLAVINAIWIACYDASVAGFNTLGTLIAVGGYVTANPIALAAGKGISLTGTFASTVTMRDTVWTSGPISEDALLSYAGVAVGVVDPTTVVSTALNWNQFRVDVKNFNEAIEAWEEVAQPSPPSLHTVPSHYYDRNGGSRNYW
jgi:RHS repeat-associated protein/uncharacterized repeat protein (TIGR01451 family)